MMQNETEKMRVLNSIVTSAKEILTPQLLQNARNMTSVSVDLLCQLSPDFNARLSTFRQLVFRQGSDFDTFMFNVNMAEKITTLHEERILGDAGLNYNFVDLVLVLFSLKAEKNVKLDEFMTILAKMLKFFNFALKEDYEKLKSLQVILDNNTAKLVMQIIYQYIEAAYNAALIPDAAAAASKMKECYDRFYNTINETIINPVAELTLEHFDEAKQRFLSTLRSNQFSAAEAATLRFTLHSIFLAEDIYAASSAIAQLQQVNPNINIAEISALKQQFFSKNTPLILSTNPVIRFLQKHVAFIRKFFKHRQQKYFKRVMLDNLIRNIDECLGERNVSSTTSNLLP